MLEKPRRKALVGVVGPCSAGKSTLITGLERLGYSARHIAQEHSFVPTMWKQLADPKVLVYLDVSYPVSMSRRKLEMSDAEFAEEKDRLQHAREHADLFLDTDPLTAEQVLERVLEYFKMKHLAPDSVPDSE